MMVLLPARPLRGMLRLVAGVVLCLSSLFAPVSSIPSTRVLDAMLGEVGDNAQDGKLWVLLVAGSSG